MTQQTLDRERKWRQEEEEARERLRQEEDERAVQKRLVCSQKAEHKVREMLRQEEDERAARQQSIATSQDVSSLQSTNAEVSQLLSMYFSRWQLHINEDLLLDPLTTTLGTDNQHEIISNTPVDNLSPDTVAFLELERQCIDDSPLSPSLSTPGTTVPDCYEGTPIADCADIEAWVRDAFANCHDVIDFQQYMSFCHKFGIAISESQLHTHFTVHATQSCSGLDYNGWLRCCAQCIEQTLDELPASSISQSVWQLELWLEQFETSH